MLKIVSLPRFARCFYVGAPFLPAALSDTCAIQESSLLNVSNFAIQQSLLDRLHEARRVVHPSGAVLLWHPL